MPRLLLTALVAAIAVALLSLAVRAVGRTAQSVRAATGPRPLGETPMQRLSFVLLCALIFYAAIWGAG
ncbi:hypothetical protein PARPLA_02271 [Rhodobacteraceae bacterium THAF1]|uniref:hypothetical protein n=1 Tax=Palleronia sp. THAF1 TaxID=2587842 RepID=UPI000F3E231A|nr:hypothetical protein [Palleronia sp. THAF1]QFU09305.1 hypothetical protein FIU81_11535 [Palleronia sp. THAF1]VDC26698.1 hypothetical protein PARPLA_02271 [Rhodobacteraceae bacterium THAF1]